MKKLLLLTCLFAFGFNAAAAQENKKEEKNKKVDKTATVKAPLLKTDATPLELAQAALTAHGGDKFKNAKSIVQIGTASVTVPNSTQTLPVAYKMILAGDKFRFEFNSQLFNFQQIYDGENTYSSAGGASVPPLGKIGLSVLNKVGNEGYIISALPDKKKKRAFRVTTPDSFSTDFYLDPETARVVGFEAKFMVGDKETSTSGEHDTFREVDGVTLPEKFVQRFDMALGTIYANFKAKEIMVNSELDSNIFAIP